MEPDFVPGTKTQKLIALVIILLISGVFFMWLSHYDNRAFADGDITQSEESEEISENNPISLISSAPSPEVEIAPAVVPMASFGSWAIVNLLLTIVTGLLTLFLLIMLFLTRGEKVDDTLPKKHSQLVKMLENKKINNRILYLFVGMVTTVIAIVLFTATENTKLSIQLFDNYTVLHAIIMIVTLLVVVLSGIGKKESQIIDPEKIA